MSTTIPDFAEQVKQELKLTPGEAEEFLKLEVNHLAMQATQVFIGKPCSDHFEDKKLTTEYEALQTEYENLIAKASPRILKAMELYFRLLLKYYKHTK
jgi:cobalamin biosynthesis Co2+ chelatase CbiK